MGTKLPSSNWSAEILTKLFTSADAHTLMGVMESQSVQRSWGNLHFILPFIHPLSPDSSLACCFIGPITGVRSSNPRNRKSRLLKTTCTHRHPHTLAVIFFFYNLNEKWFVCFVGFFLFIFFYNIYIPASVCVCACVCVVGWFPIRSSRCAAQKTKPV